MNKRGPTPERLALAAEVKLFYDSEEAPTFQEVADRFAISRSYATTIYHDPDGSKDRARKDSYSLPCPDCGQPMSGSDGRKNGPTYCRDCSSKHHKVWTRETVIASFQSFYRRFGRSPTATDTVGRAPSVRVKLTPERLAEIVDDHGLPNPGTVRELFGTWAEAQRAAGVSITSGRGGTPYHRGPLRKTRRRDAAILQAVRDGHDTSEMISAATGFKVGNLRRRLQTLAEQGRVIRTRSGAHGHPYLYRLPD